MEHQHAEAGGACARHEAAGEVESSPPHGDWIWTLAGRMVPESHPHTPAVGLHSIPSTGFSQTRAVWQRLSEGLASPPSEVQKQQEERFRKDGTGGGAGAGSGSGGQ